MTDEAGHTISLNLEKIKKQNEEIFVKGKSFAYDDGDDAPLSVSAQYKWRVDKENKYKQLTSFIKTDITSMESRYMPKSNETWIREWVGEYEDDDEKNERDEEYGEYSDERTSEWQKLPGLVVPFFETTQGSLKIRLENGT